MVQIYKFFPIYKRLESFGWCNVCLRIVMPAQEEPRDRIENQERRTKKEFPNTRRFWGRHGVIRAPIKESHVPQCGW